MKYQKYPKMSIMCPFPELLAFFTSGTVIVTQLTQVHPSQKKTISGNQASGNLVI
jgi:hypothetical protein